MVIWRGQCSGLSPHTPPLLLTAAEVQLFPTIEPWLHLRRSQASQFLPDCLCAASDPAGMWLHQSCSRFHFLPLRTAVPSSPPPTCATLSSCHHRYSNMRVYALHNREKFRRCEMLTGKVSVTQNSLDACHPPPLTPEFKIKKLWKTFKRNFEMLDAVMILVQIWKQRYPQPPAILQNIGQKMCTALSYYHV